MNNVKGLKQSPNHQHTGNLRQFTSSESLAPDCRVSGGYVALYRKLLDHPLINQHPPVWFKIFAIVLLKANWKPGTWWDGTRSRVISPGSFVTSVEKLRQLTLCTAKQVRGCLKYLQRAETITVETTSRYTLITILNWDTYQRSDDSNGKLNEGDGGIQRPKSRHSRAKPRATIEESNHSIRDEFKHKNTCPSADGRLFELSVDNPPFNTLDEEEPNTPPPVNDQHVGPIQLKADQQKILFEQLWREYWRKEKRKDAEAAFIRHVKTEALFRKVMAAMRAQNSTMLSRELQFRPLAVTWIKGERWKDDLAMFKKAPAVDCRRGRGSIEEKSTRSSSNGKRAGRSPANRT